MKKITPTKPKQNLSLWLVSPLAVALFSGAIALVCSFIPHPLYKEMVREPFYYFFDLTALFFIALCITSFILGYLFSARFWAKGVNKDNTFTFTTVLPYLQPLAVTSLSAGFIIILANVFITLVLIRTLSFGLIIQGISGEISSTIVRQSISAFLSDNRLRWVIVGSQILSPWLLWLQWRTRGYLSARLHAYIKFVFIALVTSSIVNLLLLQNRGPMISFVMALLLVYMLHLNHIGRLSFGKVFRRGMVFILFGISYFMVIQVTRYVGQEVAASELVIAKIIGYYAGSYNRLSLLIDGWLNLPGKYHGYYWTQWLWEFPVLSNALRLQSMAKSFFGTLPVSGAAERSPYIAAAGLNGTLTSITIFSHAFIDFGWFGWLPFLPYGFLAGFLWYRFLLGSIWGVCLYPYMLWTIVEWRGYIEITRPGMPIAFLIPALLVLVARVLSKPRATFNTPVKTGGL